MTRALVAALAVALAASSGAQAAELRWNGRPFQVMASEKRLADFLRELAASQGTTAVIDPKIDGAISGKFVLSGKASDSARALLDGVCASYGLTYYFDGSLLFIELASDARSEVLPIYGANAARITEAVNRLQLTDKRFPLTINQAENQVFVSGPKRYVEAIKQIVKSIDYRASQVDRAEVQMFPLKYAWAADFQMRRGGKEVSVPGVASVLRNLFDQRSGTPRTASSTAAGGQVTAMPRISGSRQIKLPSGASVNAPKLDTAAGGPLAAPDEGDGTTAIAARSDLPQFQVDTRMNAVIVRDLPERMAQYAQLIAAMDIKPRLVEIEVTIMDISSDTLDSLGVDWRLHGSRYDLQIGNGGNGPLTWNSTTADGQTGSTTPKGGVFTASIGHEMRDFLLARVSALASKGQANFVARPKVLTLDNTEASLENKSEFYIRVQGFQDSSLYTVIAGTDVRVTPLVIDEAGSRGVMMSIDINDDNVTADAVENLPIVRRRSVVTQAMVAEGRSVLLAGYSSEERSNASVGVPLLSSIPVVGHLFRTDTKKLVNMDRFYMLTPRFVLPGESS
jgi:type III secretion protein C